MKNIQIIKKVNNTELGKGGTHETYVLVPQELDVSDIFDTLEKKFNFVDKETGKVHAIRLTSGREKRIVGLGPFYKEHDVFAGDEMSFEKRMYGDNCDFLISVNKFDDVIVFQKKKNAFAVLTPERLDHILDKEFYDINNQSVSISFVGEFKKREDSPESTKLYDIVLDGKSISGNYSNNDMLEVVADGDMIAIRCFKPWKKYVLEDK